MRIIKKKYYVSFYNEDKFLNPLWGEEDFKPDHFFIIEGYCLIDALMAYYRQKGNVFGYDVKEIKEKYNTKLLAFALRESLISAGPFWLTEDFLIKIEKYVVFDDGSSAKLELDWEETPDKIIIF